MRTSMLTITAALGAAAALTLSGCGGGGSSSSSPSSSGSSSSSSSGSASSSSSGGGAGAVSAVCKDPSTLSQNAPVQANPTIPASLKASGKVGVILPDTTSSTRWTAFDAPLLKKAFDAAGLQSDIQNAQNSTARFQQIAQGMIGEGVKVLLLASIDQTSGAAVEQQAKAAGIKVIDYDRVNLGGSANYYVSFDNELVGKLQGQTLADCLAATGKSKPGVIEMNGGTDTDHNAVLFQSGAESVLKPLASQGKLTIEASAIDKGWSSSLSAPTFSQALTAAGGNVDGVLAANDQIAGAVIGVLQQQGLAGHVVVTGQDATVQGLQYILQGTQSMTIFKNVKLEANAAAELAIDLIAGKDPTSTGLKLTPGIDPKNTNLQSVLLQPEVITQSNVEDVVTAGAATAAQVCNGIQQQCSAAGVH